MAQNLGMSSLLAMGATSAAAVAVGLALGWVVDHLAGTFPVFAIIGLAAGLVAAVGYTIVTFRTYLRQ